MKEKRGENSRSGARRSVIGPKQMQNKKADKKADKK